MHSHNTLPISEARKKIFDLADQVQAPSNYFVLTENGRPKAVMMSFDEFDSWRETVEIMKSPQTMKAIKEADSDIKKGKLKEYLPLETLLKEANIIIREKQAPYEASGRRQKKRAKKPRKDR